MMTRDQWRGWCTKAAADFSSRAFTVDAAAEVWTAWWNEARFIRAYQLRRGLSKAERHAIRRYIRRVQQIPTVALEHMHPHERRIWAAEMRKRRFMEGVFGMWWRNHGSAPVECFVSPKSGVRWE